MFSALKSATIQVNTRTRREITEKILLGILQGRVDPAPWHYHITSLFSELPGPYFLRLVKEEKLKKDTLEAVCEALPYPHSDECKMKINAYLGTVV